MMIVSRVVLILIAISLSDESLVSQNRQYPTFGRAMRQEFLLNPGLTFLNHGSYDKTIYSPLASIGLLTCEHNESRLRLDPQYPHVSITILVRGTSPKATRQSLREYQNRAEANPDLWIKREARFEMDKVRELLAKLVNASADDIVMIINTTSAMNAIFRSMVFKVGERILQFSTAYGSMQSLIKYVCDYSNGTVSALIFNVTYPISNDQIVKNFDEFLEANHDPDHPIRLALIDHITSTPGVIVPIERLIPLLKVRNITVLVDGAHAIGQIPIDITALAPDYYITNCHKWLYASRSSAMMFVDKKHQGTIHPAHINSGYSQPSDFQNEFFWTGTMDYSPYMTVPAALKFREDVGGEKAIMAYNHRLAVDGGTYLANVFGTEILQDEDQIGNMVDVRLPIHDPDNSIIQGNYWINTLLTRYPQLFVPAHKHGGKWWVRVSAQIYNDLTDFETAADVYMTMCDELNGSNSMSSTLTAPAAATMVVFGVYGIILGNKN